jgi:hypothetical protein
LGWFEHEGYLRRKLLFLDLNFWIKLSELKNPPHEQLKALLSDLVETGKLICPVSPSILMELWKQSGGTHRDSISQLMNELSKGLSLQDIYTTFPPEFEAALDGRQAERQVAYSHFLDAFHHPVPDQSMALSITDFMNEWWSGARERAAANMNQGFSERTQQ